MGAEPSARKGSCIHVRSTVPAGAGKKRSEWESHGEGERLLRRQPYASQSRERGEVVYWMCVSNNTGGPDWFFSLQVSYQRGRGVSRDVA